MGKNHNSVKLEPAGVSVMTSSWTIASPCPLPIAHRPQIEISKLRTVNVDCDGVWWWWYAGNIDDITDISFS